MAQVVACQILNPSRPELEPHQNNDCLLFLENKFGSRICKVFDEVIQEKCQIGIQIFLFYFILKSL
jgi:hypothetical protein